MGNSSIFLRPFLGHPTYPAASQPPREIFTPWGRKMQGTLPTNLISLAQAARLLPASADGRRISPSTLFRWITRGTRGVRLRAWRLGRRLYTTDTALNEFAATLSALPPARRNIPARSRPQTQRRGELQRQADLARAAAVLDAAGVR